MPKGRCKICQTTKTLITKTTNPIILTTTITQTTNQAMQTIAETTHRTKQTIAQTTAIITSPITNQAIKQITPLLNLLVQEKMALAVPSKLSYSN